MLKADLSASSNPGTILTVKENFHDTGDSIGGGSDSHNLRNLILREACLNHKTIVLETVDSKGNFP